MKNSLIFKFNQDSETQVQIFEIENIMLSSDPKDVLKDLQQKNELLSPHIINVNQVT